MIMHCFIQTIVTQSALIILRINLFLNYHFNFLSGLNIRKAYCYQYSKDLSTLSVSQSVIMWSFIWQRKKWTKLRSRTSLAPTNIITTSNQEEVLSLILFLVCLIRDIFAKTSLFLLFFCLLDGFTTRSGLIKISQRLEIEL